MSVSYIRLKRTRKWTVDDKPTTKAVSEYVVKTTDKNDPPGLAQAAVGAIGGAYAASVGGATYVDLSLTATGIDVEEMDAPGDGGALYKVTVNFSTDSENPKGPEDQNPDPTQRPGVLRLSWAETEETIYKALDAVPTAEDTDGNAIDITAAAGWASHHNDFSLCVSTGTPLPDGLKEGFADTVYTFEKNVTTFDWVTASVILDGYINTINNDFFTITYRGDSKVFRPGTAKLIQPTSEPGYENGIEFEKITFGLQVRKDGWLRKVLDADILAYNGVDYNPSKPPPRILDENGDPIKKPVGLDGKGLELPSGAKPVFLKFRTKKTHPFSLLPFDEFS